jgi:hypothetical protein
MPHHPTRERACRHSAAQEAGWISSRTSEVGAGLTERTHVSEYGRSQDREVIGEKHQPPLEELDAALRHLGLLHILAGAFRARTQPFDEFVHFVAARSVRQRAYQFVHVSSAQA